MEGRPTEEINAILSLCDSVGLPITLKGVGVGANDDSAIQGVAARSLTKGESVWLMASVQIIVDTISSRCNARNMWTIYKYLRISISGRQSFVYLHVHA